MRAVQVSELTGPDGLRVVDIDAPSAQDRVVIDVEYAGVSFPDLLLSRGMYQMKPPLPFIPGVEVAGHVRSAPDGSPFNNGDTVMAFTMLGGFAQIAVADPAFTVAVPEGMDVRAAGGFLMNYHTVHFALARRAAVRDGECVAVHGAAGGVGTAALQVARGLGAHTVALVSSDEKAEVARRAGAETVIRTDEEWPAALRALNEGRGPDVILDPVGGDRFDESVRCLAPEGRILVIGFTEGRIPSVQVNRLLFRNISVVGAAWGAFLAVEPGLFEETQRSLNEMIATGVVSPIVEQTFTLDRAAEALRALEQRRATGKLALELGA